MTDFFRGKEIPTNKETTIGNVGWRSPSNIALIKYWGKHGRQLPRNPSLSFSLSNAFTETIVNYESRAYSNDKASLEFYFEGKPNEAFKLRIQTFLDSLLEFFPFLRQTDLVIESTNSFPHSTGIASSASSMSALALCLCSIEEKLTGEMTKEQFNIKASYISRLGSGSACRSVFGGYCIWGNTKLNSKYTDEYAQGVDLIHPVFANIHDDVLIVSANEKSVSSTAGHQLMDNNPFANTRYKQANQKLIDLTSSLAEGDIDSFGKIVEEEALTLHALMMCSDPSYILMEPGTLEVISKIRNFRTGTGTPIYFTLDAGPNVHVLYPQTAKQEAQRFIREELLMHCERGRQIQDKIGTGPQKITQFSHVES